MSNSIYKTQLGDDFVAPKDYTYKRLKTHFMTESGMPICGSEYISKFSKKNTEITCKRCQGGLRLRKRLNENPTRL